MHKVPLIVIADVHGRISPQFSDTLKRHQEYIQEFRKFSSYGETQLLVIQPSFRIFRNHTLTLAGFQIVNSSAVGILRLRKAIRETNSKPILIVAGDPSESFLFAKLIKLLLLNSTIPIQVQIHGEYSKAWAKLNVRNRFRRLLARLNLKSASGIRVVTEEQKSYIAESFLIDSKKMVVVPVRLNSASLKARRQRDANPMSIGMVGRIHRERNIEKFAAIANYFCEANPSLEVIVAGGTTRDRRSARILRAISSPNLRILGHVEGDALSETWSRIGVLISTAESESYGRSLREALMHGVPVLALSSIGSRELLRECPEAVMVFTENETDVEIYEKFRKILACKVPLDFRKNQEARDLNVGSQVARSWKDTIEDEPIG